ncbi:MAG: hypothetical protein PHE48_01935 [Candidatus Daviesbacteria bacterium]|nr:hypothetical protein [Candidatus Daviesbacteria bacterium]
MKLVYLQFLLVLIISYLILIPSFGIGLYGDDWLAIFRYVVHVNPPSKEGWNLFSYYLTPYGSQDIIMGLLHQFFGNNAFYYEVTSYIFRLFAAFSLYPLVFYLTKNKLATFFAMLFFSITTIGFDSTGWLLTMPTYLTIAFFNIFLYFYIIFHETKKIRTLLFSGIFFYLACVTASQRMIGAPLFILSLEAFWLIKNKTFDNLKHSFLKVIFVFTILLTIGISGYSLGNSGDWFSRLNSSITTIQKMLSEGRSDFLLYPIITIGGMFIPNFAFPNIQINTKSDMLSSVTLPAIALFLIFLIIFKANIEKFDKDDIKKCLITASIWIFSVFVVRKLNIVTFSSSNMILMSIVGGLAIIIWILLMFKYQTQKNILTALFISFSWTLFSFFMAWLWNPASPIDSTHRYLTTSAIGISILLAIIISLGKKFKNQVYLALLLSLFLILHITSTRTSIDKLLNSHSQQIVDKIWSSIPRIPNIGKEPFLLFFERDETNARILGESVMFGFPFHIALLYNLTESDKFPGATDNWKDVVSAVKDGQSLKAYGYPLKPIPIDHIYAFRLQGKDNLINITNITRQKLLEER